MAVVAYVGLPGGGKSYSAFKNTILPMLLRGRIICTNVPLQIEKLKEHYNNKTGYFKKFKKAKKIPPIDFDKQIIQFTYKDTIDDPKFFSNIPHGAISVIDECQAWWPAGTNVKQLDEDQKLFFSEHRHKICKKGFAQEIILITQDLSFIASFLRKLVEKTILNKKLTALGMKNRFRYFICSSDITGQFPPKNRVIMSQTDTYQKRFYQYYKSHTRAENDQSAVDIQETGTDERGNVFKSKFIMFGMPFAIILIAFTFMHMFKFFDKGNEEKPKEKSQEISEQSKEIKPIEKPKMLVIPEIKALPNVEEIQKKSEEKTTEKPTKQEIIDRANEQYHASKLPAGYSEKWRLKGTLESEFYSIAIIVSNDGQFRELEMKNNCYKVLGHYECLYEGKKINSFSGVKEQETLAQVQPIENRNIRQYFNNR